MSTAVYYHQDHLGIEESYSKTHITSSNIDHQQQQNSLPPLAHLMPLGSTNTPTKVSNPAPTQPNSTAPSSDLMYPVVSANNFPGYQPLPEVPTQSSNSYHSSVNNTPATPLNNNYTASGSMLAPHNSIPGPSGPMMPQHPLVGGPGPQNHPMFNQPPVQEKCTCKSNPNRIPRPRNAFILFRQKYHQSVLDESTETKTNPEVSRELGRRWRSLSPQEREHWTNLAEEEKKNHAKKYPNYRYTPRRHGKGKHCPSCQQKQLRQAQLNQQQQQNKQQQMRSLSSDDGLMGQQNLQKSPLNQNQNYAPQMQPFSLQQQYSSGQNSLSGQPLQQPMQQSQQPQQQNPYISSQMGQFVFQTPFNQVGPQYGFPDQHQQQQQPQGSPLQQGVQGQPQNQPLNEKSGFNIGGDMNQPHFMGYEQSGNHQQRFNSLPTTMGNNSFHGPEVYMQPQAPHQR